MCVPTKFKLEIHDHDEQPCRPRRRKSKEIIEISPGKNGGLRSARGRSSFPPSHTHWRCHSCSSFVDFELLICHRCGQHRHHRPREATPPPPPAQSPKQPPHECKDPIDAEALKKVLVDAGKDIAADCFERAAKQHPPASSHRSSSSSSATSAASYASKGSVRRLRDSLTHHMHGMERWMGSQVNLLKRASHDTNAKVDHLGATTARQLSKNNEDIAALDARAARNHERTGAAFAGLRLELDDRVHAIGDRVRSVDDRVHRAGDHIRDVDDRLRAHLRTHVDVPPPPQVQMPVFNHYDHHHHYQHQHQQHLPAPTCDHAFDCRCRDRMLDHRIHGLERKADVREAVEQARAGAVFRRRTSDSSSNSNSDRGRSRSRSRHRYVREVYEDVDASSPRRRSPRERVRILPYRPSEGRERWEVGWERDERVEGGVRWGRGGLGRGRVEDWYR